MIDVLQIAQGRKIATLIEHTQELANIDHFLRNITIENQSVIVRSNNNAVAFTIGPISYYSSNLNLSASEIILTKTQTTATVTFSKNGNGTVTMQYVGNPKYRTASFMSPTYNLTSSQVTFQYKNNTNQLLRNVYKITVADTEEYVGSFAYLRVVQVP